MILIHIGHSGALKIFDAKSQDLIPFVQKNYVAGKASRVGRTAWTTKGADGILRVWTIQNTKSHSAVAMLPKLPESVREIVSVSETGKFVAVRTKDNKLLALENGNGKWTECKGRFPEADSPSNITIDEKSSEFLVTVIRRFGANGSLVSATLFRLKGHDLKLAYQNLRVPFGRALGKGKNWFGSSDDGTFKISSSRKVEFIHQGFAYFLGEPGTIGYMLNSGKLEIRNIKYERPVGNSLPVAFFPGRGVLWGSVFGDRYWIGGKSYPIPEPGVWLFK